MPSFPRCDVSLLNDDDTPMDLVVGVLEHFFGMSDDEAITQMLRIHNDVLAFAAKHKHPLQCVLEQEE